MFGKTTSQKIAKYRFLYKHDYRDQKMVEKTGGNNYSRNTPIVPAKISWEKIVAKYCKKHFLYSHEYRDQKMGGKKHAKQFFQEHTNSARKICWGKKSL